MESSPPIADSSPAAGGPWNRFKGWWRVRWEKGTEEEGWDRFYRAFEDRFRGDERTIYERLSTRYGARLASLRGEVTGPARALDIGCGHGEFLQLLREQGFAGVGVESSQEACRRLTAKGYAAARSGDGLAYLRRQPARSAAVIALLHVVEHCPPRYVYTLLRETHRVLAAGGALLIETPSLYSLWASQRQFYLDPTHQTPVHPEYLVFLAEHLGFAAVEPLEFDEVVHPLRPERSEDDEAGRTLDRWLFGPMDFAIWARRR